MTEAADSVPPQSPREDPPSARVNPNLYRSLEMSLSDRTHAAIAARIAALRARHRDLDARVEQEQKRAWRDMSVLQRLKRRRLRLKDELGRYEGLLRTLARRRLPG
ncbi:DUF465 domain-containing protein [Thioclava sp. NG1]|nr:hypothetical protein B6V72_13695 [Thioclava sp. F34-6]PWE49116.1 DUF465 domain-containing protein [Thioclava sp. NG1]